MTMQGKKRTTVEVAVTGHKDWKGKPAIDLKVPEWKSDYDTTLYNVSEDAQKALWLGFTGKVVLEGSPKKDKDTTRPYNWFWDFVEVAQGGGATSYEETPYLEPPDDELFGAPNTSRPAPLPTKRTESPEVNFSAMGDARQSSIERQVAFKESIGIVNMMGIEHEASWWYALNYATDIGESILNRTYGQENLAEKLEQWLDLIYQEKSAGKDKSDDSPSTADEVA